MMVTPPDARHARTMEDDPSLLYRRRKEMRWRGGCREARAHDEGPRSRADAYLSQRSSIWRLGTLHVEAGAAELIIKHRNVIGVGDALFRDVRSQTYRFIEEQED